MGTLIFMVICGFFIAGVLLVFYFRRNRVRDKDVKEDSTVGNTSKRDDLE